MSSTIGLINYKPWEENVGITVADGSMCKAVGQVDIEFSSLKLKLVLYVLDLKCNLLSISKITKDSNCSIIFSPSCCEFQDFSLGRMIGNAKEQNSLYYLSSINSPSTSKTQPIVLSIVSNSNVKLWHNGLGHPSFSYLKYLYPQFFINKNPSSFHCDHCVLEKQPREHPPPYPYKPSTPFHLIHSNVWGPSRVPNLTRDGGLLHL